MPRTNIQDVIFRRLVTVTELTGRLATNSLDPTLPAIFDRWTPSQNAFPYMNLSFVTNQEGHVYKNRCSLEIDIFCMRNQVEANEIFQILKKELNKSVVSVDGISYRVFYERDEEVPEPEDDITHWNGEFTIVWWDSE